MPTFTLSGFQVTRNATDTVVAVDPLSLSVFVPEGQTTFSYSILGTEPDDIPEVDITSDAVSVIASGPGVPGGVAALPDDSLSFLGTVTTSTGTHTLLVFEVEQDDGSFLDAFFQIGGDPLAVPGSVTAFQAIEDGVTQIGAATGAFAPGATISFSSLANTTEEAGPNQVVGSDGDDDLVGTSGDDLITTGDNPGFDNVVGSAGDDIIDFTGITSNPGGFVSVDYRFIATTIDVQVDGGANTASVVKAGLGTDTFTNVELPLLAGWTTGGLSILGTSGADRFNVSPEGEQWMSIRPGDGLDTIIVNADSATRVGFADPVGAVRLDMSDGNGLNVDLSRSTGQIIDDGFGNTETIGGTGPLWEVFGSAGNDVFTGSANAESFRPTGGNDTLDGGAGFDRLRYDSFQITSVNIDATAGIATGTLNTGGTFTDTISGFERLRGSDGDDQITGEAGVGNRYVGRGGTDTFVHLGGADTISDFDVATETLIVRRAGLTQAAVDAAISGATDQGDDTRVDFGSSSILFSGLNGADLAGANVQVVNLDSVNLIEGTDTLEGTAGDDVIVVADSMAFTEAVVGSSGNDVIDLTALNFANGYVELLYSGLGGPITVDIDGAANTGSVVKSGGGTDTLLGVQNPLVAGNTNGGLLVEGTASGDTFNLNLDGGQWMELRPGDGQDQINLTGDGIVRLSFSDATNGIDVDLRSNTINDDGFGNTETITGNTPWGIRGSAFDDVFFGGDGDDNFRKFGGNDDVHGGGGSDRLRYESSLVESVSINVQEGTATGTLSDGGTFNDTFSGFERFRGSSGNDEIIGDGEDNRLEGRNGNDTLGGGFGNDNYSGGSGADTFVFSGGFDFISDFEIGTDTMLINIPGLTQADVDAAFANPFEFQGRYFAPFGEDRNITFDGLTPEQISSINATLGDGGLSAPSPIEGTDGDDTLVGTNGDDLITTGDNPGFDNVVGSAGDDTIDLSGITDNPGGFVSVDYSGIGATIDVTLDGGDNTASVVKTGLGTDTFLNIELPLFAGWTTGGMEFLGTSGNDTFDVSPEGEQWMSIRPGDGVDTIIINANDTTRVNSGDPIGQVRLDMSDGNGIDVNLATRTINNDGFGNSETIGGTGPVWEVRGSGGDDIFVGSDNAESYRYTGGNNDLSGGLGFDRLRYDSSGVASVVIDAAAGVVSGTFDGGGTFTDTISGFERLRGSNGDDTIIGEATVGNRYEGRGGADSFVHLGGDDTIGDFNAGEDTLVVRVAGLDQAAVEAAMAAATDAPGDVSGSFSEGARVTFGGSTVTFAGLTATDLAGANVQFVAPSGANPINGTDGNDDLVGTPGDDLIITGDNAGGETGFDFVTGSTGNDTIDMSGITDGYVGIGYAALNGTGNTIAVTIDGAANTGTVDKGAVGTDTLVAVEAPLFSGWTNGGLSVRGTSGNDTFDISLDGEQWMSIRPGDGTDTIILNGSASTRVSGFDPIGAVRLDMRDGNGINVNLATGVIADDGFGNAEVIQGNTPLWEVLGSGGNDVFTGSGNAESFRSWGGNNTLDGGAGFDRLRYDSDPIASVNIDASAGTSTGSLNGGGSFTDTFTGFEWLRGSNGTDVIAGDTNDNRLDGRGGTDTFVHVGGNDTIGDFDAATETLIVRVAGLTQAQVDAAMAGATDTTDGALVAFDSGSVLFTGRTAADLAGANVQFVAPSGANPINGSDGDDVLVGTAGDDLITTGDNPGFDNVVGSAGNDTIDLSGITDNPGGFVSVDYSGIGATIDVTLDGGDNTASVVKTGLGTDTFLNIELPLFAGWTTGGMEFLGTSGNDTFDVSPEGEQWMSIRPGDGVDTIIINANDTTRVNSGDPIGQVRLDMSDGNRIDVNLATRTINNDGFGNSETIGGTGPVWEVRGSGGDDIFVGSDNAESYRYTGGNNDLSGGLGFDRLRYDSSGVASVVIDAAAGVVSGTFDGGGTFTDTISGFERLRGSNGDDTIIGEATVGNRYEGRGGADSFVHLGGDDTIGDFNAGEDTLVVRVAGLDQAAVDAAMAAATDAPGDVSGSFSEGARVTFGGSTVTFAGLTVADLAGADVQFVAPSGANPINGTDDDDNLVGTAGDDLITTGNASLNGDFVEGSAGNDTIDMSGNDGTDGFVTLGYGALNSGIFVSIDGAANTGTVDKGANGTDTLVGVAQPLFAGFGNGGLGVLGTSSNDSFTLAPGADQWMQVRGGDGADSYEINGDGPVRLDFAFTGATGGAQVNLATGAIADDGFGNAETITGTNNIWEVRGTANADAITGGAADESFISRGGDDTIDGGGGFDRLRYDRSGAGSASVDLAAGTATGSWDGVAFTNTISNIEWVRGSNSADTLAGDTNDNRLDGRGGTDTFVHVGGNDTIGDFDATTETLIVRVAGLTQAQVDAAMAAATDQGTDTLVNFGSSSILFSGLSRADLAGVNVQVPGAVAPPPPPTPIGWTVGDPHLLTLDGVGYDFHAIGEFVLLRGTGSFSGFEIQSRMGPVLDSTGAPVPNVSANVAIAARAANGTAVMIDATDASPLSIGGVATALDDGASIDVGADRVFRQGDTYTLVFAGADGTVGDGDARMSVIVRDGFVDVGVQISTDMAGQVEGLLGDGDGNPDNDIALADGTVLARPLAFEDLYGNAGGTVPNLRDDWRVTTDGQSLFTYDAGETLAGFYDPTAPAGDPTAGATDQQVADARTAVEEAGLTPGTLAFENAVQDVLLTGDNMFIESSSTETAPTPANTGSAGTLAAGDTRVTLDVSLTDEGDNGIGGAVVNFSAGGVPILGQAAGTAGSYNVRLGSSTGEGRVDAVRDFETGDGTIDVSDALNALRLAVNLTPSFGAADAKTFIAADVDQNEAVTVADALDILRFAVGLETPNAPRWVFLDDEQDLSGIDADTVSYQTGIDTGPIADGASLQLSGVLLGDILAPALEG
jgi:Ca2+-binding RTX toxin-like protein